MLALNAYLIQPLRPFASGMASFHGSGVGSRAFDNYRDDFRMKRIQEQNPGKSGKKLAEEDRERRKHKFWYSHVLMDPDLMIMIMMSVTEAHASEKKQIREIVPTANTFWPLGGHLILTDGGLDDVAVRDVIVQAGALPFVKWQRKAENAINPSRRSEVDDETAEIIELTFELARQLPKQWLALHGPRWKSETLFGAVQMKYDAYARSLSLEGATTQIITKYVCNTIDRLAYFWRVMNLDKKCFGAQFQLGSGEDGVE